MNINGIEILTSFLSNYIQLNGSEKENINNIITKKTFSKKEIIIREGDIQQYLGFILKGAVRLYYIDKNGNEITFEFALENSPIGSFKGIITKAPSPAFVSAIEETVIIGVHSDKLLALLNDNPIYYKVISEFSSEAIKQLLERDKLLRIPSSRERYFEFLKTHQGYIQRIPLTYIASYLNVALGTLSRIRSGKL